MTVFDTHDPPLRPATQTLSAHCPWWGPVTLSSASLPVSSHPHLTQSSLFEGSSEGVQLFQYPFRRA